MAPHAAYDCVDGAPNDAHSVSGKTVPSTVHPGRVVLIAFLIGMSTINVSAVIVMIGASAEMCHRPFQPTVASGSLK